MSEMTRVWHSGGGGNHRSWLLRLSFGISLLVALAFLGATPQSAELEETQGRVNYRPPTVAGGDSEDTNPILLNVGQGTTGTTFLSNVMRKRLGFTGSHMSEPKPKHCLWRSKASKAYSKCDQTILFLHEAHTEMSRRIRNSKMQFIMDTPCGNIPKYVVQQAKDLDRGPIVLLSKRNVTEWAKRRVQHPAPLCANSDVVNGLDWEDCVQQLKNHTVPFNEVFVTGKRAGLQRLERAYRTHLATWEPRAHVVLDLFTSQLRWTEDDVIEGFKKCGILKEADSPTPPFGGYQLERPPKLGCEIFKDPIDGVIHVKHS
jgi:hypothetical protein